MKIKLILQSFTRYLLAGFSAAVALYLREHGFNPEEADKLALSISGGISAVILIWWSLKKNGVNIWWPLGKKSNAIADERERLRQNNGDPITYKNPTKKDNYND